MKLKILLLIFAVLGCGGQKTARQDQKIESGVLFDSGAVSSVHSLASQAGIETLKKGGNAIDASLATFFTLSVVFPRAGNIGGGGFAVVRMGNGESYALDFREKAPLMATKDMFLDAKGQPERDKSMKGALAAGVPGSVAGMVALHDKLGKLPFEELLGFAIAIAEKGFALSQEEAQTLQRFQQDFKTVNGTEILFNRSWKAGDTLKQPELAQTLKRIAQSKGQDFYKGKTAELLVGQIKKAKGIISHKDLEQYQAVWREPITFFWKGHKVITMPPPSSGGVAIAQLLMGGEDFSWSEFGSPKTIHLMTELERRVFADRATFMGDPDFEEILTEKLISKSYIHQRFKDIDTAKRTPSQQIKEGQVKSIESVETTHLSVIDRFGNTVSLTTTLNSFFGCKLFVKDAGFFLNNEMDDFSVKAGVANQFGLVGAEANAIKPSKRMLSSMTPTIVSGADASILALGSPGGSTIITTVYQVLLNFYLHKMSLQQAIDAPRFHHQWLPDEINVEKGFLTPAFEDSLKKRGHTLKELPKLGRIDAVFRHSNLKIEAANDHKRSGDKPLLY
jgi:gamma-glutamyltranspeptidase/glutathione hydrolase